MPTEALNGRVVLTDFGGPPVDPQPAELDSVTHRGVVLRSADGSSTKRWYFEPVFPPDQGPAQAAITARIDADAEAQRARTVQRRLARRVQSLEQP